jgi:hypothetical protein
LPSIRIFVSYVQTGDERGAEIAEKLIGDLQTRNAEIVTDNDTLSDEKFIAFLTRELPQCKYLIFVQTPVSLQSQRAQTAVNVAISMGMRNVLCLIAVAPEGSPDSQPHWKAPRIFDASTDYPRARDRLLIELGLITLDESASFPLPFSSVAPDDIPVLPRSNLPPVAPPSRSIPGFSIPVNSSNPPPITGFSGSLPIYGQPPTVSQPSGAHTVIPPALQPSLPGPSPQPTSLGSSFQPSVPLPPNAPGLSSQPTSPGSPFQPPIPPRGSVHQPPFSSGQGGYSNSLPSFGPPPAPIFQGSTKAKPLSPKSRFKTWQTRIAPPKGKPAFDELETLLEDRPPPINTTRRTVIRWSAITLALLLVLSSILTTVLLVKSHSSSGNTGQNNTSTAQPTSDPTSVPPTSAQGNTPDPRNTTDPYYSNINNLKLNDDLASNSQYQWRVSSSDPTKCRFINNTYDVTSNGPNYCLAEKSNFSDFVYQIQIKILQGTAAGIVFRATDANKTFYYFLITTDGRVMGWRSDPSQTGLVQISHPAFADAVKRKLNQTNVLAVYANGGQLTFFVNGTPVIGPFSDSTYSNGHIGVMVGLPNDKSTTEAAYQYAKVWTS